MKRGYFGIIFCFCLVVAGCAQQDNAAVKVGPVNISGDDFQAAYNDSFYAAEKNIDKRREFLDNYISKKLILLEAERLGLDEDPAFLQDIQLFWEQGLLKRALKHKNDELAKSLIVTDKEIKQYYEKHLSDSFTNKSLEDASPHIREIILKAKQSAALIAWTNSLRRKHKVDIDYKQLGI